jgi:hypothetical protein
MKNKMVIVLVTSMAVAMPTAAQEVDMATAMRALEKPVQQWRSAIKTNYDLDSYGKCASVGITVAANEIKGVKFKKETVILAAYFIKTAESYYNQSVAEGIPPHVFDNVLTYYTELSKANPQKEFDQNFIGCSNLVVKIRQDAEKSR